MSESDVELRFKVLYEANRVALLGYVARRVELRDDAADVVAEVFTVVWRRIEDVPPDGQARPWLYGVARNVLSNHQRSKIRRARLHGRVRQEHDLMKSALGSGDDHGHDVRRALWGLSADDRELLLLTSWEGLSPTEVAVAMDIPPGTVRSRLHRARQQLRRDLAQFNDEAAGIKRRGKSGDEAVRERTDPTESEELR